MADDQDSAQGAPQGDEAKPEPGKPAEAAAEEKAGPAASEAI